MSGQFAEGSSEDESWLREHKKNFPKRKLRIFQTSPKRGKREPLPPPIHVGTGMQTCPHCRRPALVDTFRDTKCLGCQATDFLQTL